MNRLNTVIPPTLKSKAIEETESVSKGIARRLYQAVSSNNNAASNTHFNFGESRSLPQNTYRPIVKSTSTPNLRANLSSSNANNSSTPNTTPQPSPRQLHDDTVSAVVMNSPSVLQRRAMSMQNLSQDTAAAAASATTSPSLASPLSTSLPRKSLFATAASTIASNFPALFLMDPSTLTSSAISSGGTNNSSLFAADSQENSVLKAEAKQEQAEDDYVTHALSWEDETPVTPPTMEQPNTNTNNYFFSSSDIHNTYQNNDNSSNTKAQSTPPNNIEWFAEPAVPEDDIVVVVSPKVIKRRVSFSMMARVILIPTKEEYYAAGLDEHLWWKSWEMREFKQNAYREVLHIMETHGLAQAKEAFRHMSCSVENGKNHQDEYSVFNSPANVPETDNSYYNTQIGTRLHLKRNGSMHGNLHALAVTASASAI